MRFNRDGRLYAHLNKYIGIPQDFCRLFWYSLVSTVGVALIGATIGIMIMWLLGGTIFFYHSLYMGFFLDEVILQGFWGTGGSVSLVLQALGCILLFSKIVLVLGSKTKRSRAGENVSEAYHGFKDKYCPIIEWVEDDK